jgi:hypothetical protein
MSCNEIRRLITRYFGQYIAKVSKEHVATPINNNSTLHIVEYCKKKRQYLNQSANEKNEAQYKLQP